MATPTPEQSKALTQSLVRGYFADQLEGDAVNGPVTYTGIPDRRTTISSVDGLPLSQTRAFRIDIDSNGDGKTDYIEIATADGKIALYDAQGNAATVSTNQGRQPLDPFVDTYHNYERLHAAAQSGTLDAAQLRDVGAVSPFALAEAGIKPPQPAPQQTQSSGLDLGQQYQVNNPAPAPAATDEKTVAPPAAAPQPAAPTTDRAPAIEAPHAPVKETAHVDALDAEKTGHAMNDQPAAPAPQAAAPQAPASYRRATAEDLATVQPASKGGYASLNAMIAKLGFPTEGDNPPSKDTIIQVQQAYAQSHHLNEEQTRQVVNGKADTALLNEVSRMDAEQLLGGMSAPSTPNVKAPAGPSQGAAR